MTILYSVLIYSKFSKWYKATQTLKLDSPIDHIRDTYFEANIKHNMVISSSSIFTYTYKLISVAVAKSDILFSIYIQNRREESRELGDGGSLIEVNRN